LQARVAAVTAAMAVTSWISFIDILPERIFLRRNDAADSARFP
jgi:hypothetical protein